MKFSNYTDEQLIEFAKSYIPKGKTDLTPLIYLEADKRGIEVSELEPTVSYGVGNNSLDETIRLIKMTFESVNDENSHLPINEKCIIVQEALAHGYDLEVDVEKIKLILEKVQ